MRERQFGRLVGIFAHEVGHIVLKHTSSKLSLDEMQDEADRWAYGVVGRSAVNSGKKLLNRHFKRT